MRKTYKYKLYNQKNIIKLGNMIDDMWQIHLHVMKLHRRYYRIFGRAVYAYKMKRHITKIKKRSKIHWDALPSQVVQDVVLRIGKAYDAFFRNINDRKKGKTTKKVGRPHIKPQSKYNSMTFTQAGYKIEGNRIRINCFNTWYTFHKHREIEGVIKTVTIKRDKCGDYWVCFSCDGVDNSKPISMTGKSAGFDFGLKTFLTCSDGTKIKCPQYLKQSLSKLRLLNKSLSRKTKYSNGWYRIKRAVARLHRKISRQRKDWQWQLATELCRMYDTVCFETLNIEGMRKFWGRKISDVAFCQFIEILKYKCIIHGKQFIQIGRWTPSTKSCSKCGHENKNLELTDRQWVCPKCDTYHDRDINAAINILQAGIAS